MVEPFGPLPVKERVVAGVPVTGEILVQLAAFIFPLVIGPTLPFGVISYALWNALTEASVALPKYPVGSIFRYPVLCKKS